MLERESERERGCVCMCKSIIYYIGKCKQISKICGGKKSELGLAVETYPKRPRYVLFKINQTILLTGYEKNRSNIYFTKNT